MDISTTFTPKELYGGAIAVDIPSDYIDASDLRQIPDHQEVFLSKSTLTSIIFEINVYQVPSAVDVHSNIRRSSTSQADDESASTYHFLDPIAAPDHLDPASVDLTPEKVTMLAPSLAKYPAYRQSGTIVGPELDMTTRSILPPEWARSPAMKATETRCHQLLVRMREHGTDLCVRVNVPLKELGKGEGSTKAGEEQFATLIVRNLISSLSVNDFSLFAEDE